MRDSTAAKEDLLQICVSMDEPPFLVSGVSSEISDQKQVSIFTKG